MVMNMATLAFKDKKESEKGSGPSKLVGGENWGKEENSGRRWRDSKCLGQETRETNESATKNDFGEQATQWGGEVIFLSESEKGHFELRNVVREGKESQQECQEGR